MLPGAWSPATRAEVGLPGGWPMRGRSVEEPTPGTEGDQEAAPGSTWLPTVANVYLHLLLPCETGPDLTLQGVSIALCPFSFRQRPSRIRSVSLVSFFRLTKCIPHYQDQALF